MKSYDYEKCPQGITKSAVRGNNINYIFLESFIGSRIRNKKKFRILELGVGGGRNLQVIKEKFGKKVELYGTDISNSAISYARSLNIGTFIVAKADIVPFEKQFDLILIIDLLEHLSSKKEVQATLKNASKYLSTEGNIYISVPVELNIFCLTWLFSKISFTKNLTKKFYGHTLQFTPRIIVRLVNKKLILQDKFFSVHFFTQIQVLFFFYIPKILFKFFLGEKRADDFRDSNEILKEKTSTLNIIKKNILGLSKPLAFLGYRESLLRKRSSFASGNLHLLLSQRVI